jgi:site-specific recombinase XerD
VFQGRRSDRLQPDAVTAIFDRHVSQALPGKRITPHVLRRTFATLLYQNGGSLLAISRLLGHASVTTTAEHYVQVDADDLRQAVARHPLSGAVQLQLPGM